MSLILSRLQFAWKKHQRLLIVVGVLLLFILAGIIFRLLTPPPGPIIQPPTYAPITPKPGINPPQTVNLNRLAPISLPSEVPAYNLIFSEIDNHQQIAKNLGFSNLAKTVQKTIYYSNNRYTLIIDQQQGALFYVYNDETILNTKGSFSTSADLLAKTTETLRSLNLYDPQIDFQLLSTYLGRQEGEYLIPASEAEAQVKILSLTPRINSLPIYRQDPLLAAAYNRENTLVKLDIFYPIESLTPGEQTSLLSFQQIRALPPSAFFPLYIEPTSVQESLSGPTGLNSLTPEQLILGYFLDTKNSLLQPIFTYNGNTTANQPYIYATLAFPTSTP